MVPVVTGFPGGRAWGAGVEATNHAPIMQTKNKPVHEVRIGTIKAAVWKNETDNGRYYSTSLQRSYKDGNEWKHTDYFGRDDLLVVAKVADLAHTWICEQNQNQERAQDRNPEPEPPEGGRYRQQPGPSR
jgi:hypothetical protein